MPGGYGIDPRMLVSGQPASGGVPYAQPDFQGLMTQLAYQLAGKPPQTTDRHISIPSNPLMPAPSDIIRNAGGGSASDALSTLNNARDAKKLYDRVTGPSAAPSGIAPGVNGAPAGIDVTTANLGNVTPAQMFGTSGAGALGSSAAAPISLFGSGAADLGAVGAGALFGTSGAAALGAAPAASIPLFGAGAADLGTIGAGQMFGTSASAAGSGAAGSGAAASGGLGAVALPVAIGLLATQYGNKAFAGGVTASRNMEALLQGTGAKGVNFGRVPLLQLSDGRYVAPGTTGTKLADLYFRAYYEGGDMKAYEDYLKSLPTVDVSKFKGH